MESSNNISIYQYDWAICILEKPLGSYVNDYFGCQSYGSSSELNHTSIKLTGYPADTSYGYTANGLYQYETGDKITGVANNYFNYSGYVTPRF